MKPKSTHRAPLALYVWRHLAAAFALLPAVTVTAITTGTIGTLGTGPALANMDCLSGWSRGGGSNCPAQAAPKNTAIAAVLSCRPGSSMPGCAAQTPTPSAESPTPTATALTASFHGLPDAHDGSGLFTFELRFSEEFSGLRLGMLRRTLEVTGGRLVGVKRTVRGQNRRMTVRVRPSSSGEVTVALPQVGWLWDAAAATVSGPSAPVTPSALTASFHGLPDQHNGKKLFSFEIRFSEEFSGLRLTALKRALEVTGGRLIDVKRTVRGQNRRVTVRVRPASPYWGGPPITHLTLAELKSLNLHPLLPKNVDRTDPTTSAPSELPSGTGTVVNMNTMGPSTVGGATKPNLQVRERYIRGGHYVVEFPCWTGDFTYTTCSPGTNGGVDAYARWFSYPHNAGTNDMKVHLRVHRTTYPREVCDGCETGKYILADYFTAGKSDITANADYFFDYMDFFRAEAHLQAPGNAVQPTGSGSVQWTGKVIGLDSKKRYTDHTKRYTNFYWRGDLIGGDARVTLTFNPGSNPVATAVLWNLVGANTGTSYSDLRWGSMEVSNGAFSADGTGTLHAGTLSATFRGTNGATLGGTFEVTDTMVGGFVVNRQ